MCFSVPVRVLRLTPGGAVVARGEARFEVSTLLIEGPVTVGDWLAVQAQRHALAVLTEAEAAEMLELYATITRHLEGSDP